MAAGWIYVLMNPAIPNMVKVGKTTRDVEQRVAELSQPTGVPSPFVLIYKRWFSDCDIAEAAIHDLLERDGQRYTSSREFFAASPWVVVDRIVALPDVDGEEGASSELPVLTTDPPWEIVRDEAAAYEFRTGDVLQDYARARELYRLASRDLVLRHARSDAYSAAIDCARLGKRGALSAPRL